MPNRISPAAPSIQRPIYLNAKDLTPEQLRELLSHDGEILWIDIDSSDPKQHALLTDVFHFHQLAVEDTLNPRTRVKVEEYDTYVFIVLRSMRFNSERAFEADTLRVRKLCLFLGHNYLVSVHAEPSSRVLEARTRLDGDNALSGASPAHIAHLISDAIVDAYFPILDEVDDFVDTLEHCDLAQCDKTTFDQILKVRRIAFAVNRSLKPQREIFDVLAHRPNSLIPEDARLYFRDVYDHVLRITDSLESYGELMSTTTDSYVAHVSMRLNRTANTFSAIATIAIPFIVISSLYGMNFTWMPLAKEPAGFWIIIAVQAAISLVLLLILRWRNLL
jgi:magnesium transporter